MLRCRRRERILLIADLPRPARQLDVREGPAATVGLMRRVATTSRRARRTMRVQQTNVRHDDALDCLEQWGRGVLSVAVPARHLTTLPRMSGQGVMDVFRDFCQTAKVLKGVPECVEVQVWVRESVSVQI